MANWCYNNVIFNGNSTAVGNIRALFKEIQEKQDREEKIWLPPFVTDQNGYMVDIYTDNKEIHYRSRWVPNIEALVQIADHFQVNFVDRYDEMAMSIFGEANYLGGVLSNVQLDRNDFQACHYDPEKDLYVFEEQTYEDTWPLFVKLLENKKAALFEFKTTSTITKEELNQLYGELPEADLLLKFAEHKNFDKAREVFEAMEEQIIIEIENFLINTCRHEPEQFSTRDKFLAVSFLKQLINEWNKRKQDQQHQTGLGM